MKIKEREKKKPISSHVRKIRLFPGRTQPSYPVCPHPASQDRHISNHLKTEGVWQPRTLALLPVALKSYPSVFQHKFVHPESCEWKDDFS